MRKSIDGVQFDRLTLGLDSQRIVKWMAYACGLTYFVIIMVTSLSCLPYSENWATIPYPRAMCSTRFQDMYMVTILNVLTDAAMLCIPLPILWFVLALVCVPCDDPN